MNGFDLADCHSQDAPVHENPAVTHSQGGNFGFNAALHAPGNSEPALTPRKDGPGPS